MKFQSTPSAWRETRWPVERKLFHSNISIHSLRMEGDTVPTQIHRRCRHFNPLPPHGGRLRGRHPGHQTTDYFNPLPPHGGRLILFDVKIFRQNISIHSLRMEGDSLILSELDSPHIFQSTPSAWRETIVTARKSQQALHFNPLPPHGGRLFRRRCDVFEIIYFNPLPPHGGRPYDGWGADMAAEISIHSLRMEGDSVLTQW